MRNEEFFDTIPHFTLLIHHFKKGEIFKMPFTNTKVSVPITPQQETQLKTQLGKAISVISGKSENWLMLNFEDNCRMYFHGDNSKPLAFVEVKIYGSATPHEYSQLTQLITDILGKVLGISPNCIYIKYEEVEDWGYNGYNF